MNMLDYLDSKSQDTDPLLIPLVPGGNVRMLHSMSIIKALKAGGSVTGMRGAMPLTFALAALGAPAGLPADAIAAGVAELSQMVCIALH